jgi:aspartate-semialdehyde dehydrogenase
MKETTPRPLVAVIGGESLAAREIRELLSERTPAPRMQLISVGAENAAVLSAQDDEPVLMQSLTAESLEGSRVAFLAGSQASSRRALRLNAPGGPVLIDLSGALEEQPNARLRAPLLESPRLPLSPEHIHVVAHPAAIALALFFTRLDQCGDIRRSIVQVFEPASERGQKGIDEMQQQTVALLSFQPLIKEVYDTQVSFTLLPRYGEEAMEPLAEIELRIDRHLATLLSPNPRIPMPSLRLCQAPVFHGYSASAWVEFAEPPRVEEIAQVLASPNIEVRADSEEPATNVGAAGQRGITVGSIAPDRNHPRAAWFWIVADNLRLPAENALAIAEEAL